MTNAKTSRKTARPQNDSSRADTHARPRKRVPIHGNRDILTVEGKDKAYVYRWVKDSNENGGRILRFKNAGYEFVRSDEKVEVGQSHVYKSENDGAIIAVKEGVGFNYLMKIKREWYEEDQVAKAQKINNTERQIKRPRHEQTDDGMYGETKLSQRDL